MPSINVPREVVSGLKAVAALDASIRSRITEVLRSEAASLDPSAIADTLTRSVEGLQKTTAQEVVDCLIALEFARASTNISPEKLTSEVIRGVEIDEKETADLSVWLQETLGADPLMISAKGISVMQDNERTFLSARVITDIRPVYREALSETPHDAPSAAVIVHSLKLGVREAGRYREFFVVLDNDDLATLQRTLQRAEAKTKTLSSFLQSAKINYLEAQSSQNDD